MPQCVPLPGNLPHVARKHTATTEEAARRGAAESSAGWTDRGMARHCGGERRRDGLPRGRWSLGLPRDHRHSVPACIWYMHLHFPPSPVAHAFSRARFRRRTALWRPSYKGILVRISTVNALCVFGDLTVSCQSPSALLPSCPLVVPCFLQLPATCSCNLRQLRSSDHNN